MRVALVTPYDARDIRRMSGTGYSIARTLERHGATLTYVGPLRRQIHPANVVRHLWNRRVRGLNDHPQRDPGFLRHFARQVERALARTEVDVVVASGGMGIAYVESDLPLVLWTDCTFANLEDFYPKFSNLSARSRRDGHAMDRSLFARITRAILTSQWAADSAVRDYDFPRDRIAVIPRGANLPMDRTAEDVREAVRSRPTDRIRLCFVGLDWTRKGGPLLGEIGRVLEQRGHVVEIHAIGVEPSPELPELVTAHGRLDKGSEAGLARFTELVSRSHLLVIPTRAEASGIAFCEGAALGVPSLGPAIGGLADTVREGVTGHLLDPDARPEDYADRIESLLADPAAYEALALSAFEDAVTRTSWDVVGRRAMAVLADAVAAGPRRPHGSP